MRRFEQPVTAWVNNQWWLGSLETKLGKYIWCRPTCPDVQPDAILSVIDVNTPNVNLSTTDLNKLELRLPATNINISESTLPRTDVVTSEVNSSVGVSMLKISKYVPN